jgi:hypothetical protein
MNEPTNLDTERLQRLLDEVTRPGLSAGGQSVARPQLESLSESADAEAVALREAWMAFAQLVQAADDSLPAVAVAMPSELKVVVPRRPQQRRWIRMIASVAAMAIVAATLGWWIVRGIKQQHNGIDREPALAQKVMPKQPQTVKPAVAPQSAVVKKTNEGAKAATSTTSGWDDPLETQIASVSQQIQDTEQNWRRRTDDVDLVQYSIDEVSNSVKNDEL